MNFFLRFGEVRSLLTLDLRQGHGCLGPVLGFSVERFKFWDKNDGGFNGKINPWRVTA